MLQSDTTVQGATQDQASTQIPAAVTEPTLKELNDRFVAMEAEHKRATAELEERKREISGLNRKISEDEKVIKQKELEKLSEVEKEKALTEMARKEREAEEAISASLRRDRIVDKALFDAGIPLEFAKRVSGKEESEILEDVKVFKDYIDKLVNEKKEKAVNEALAGKAPAAGKAPNASLRQQLINQYNEAENRKDAPQMMLLKAQIRSLPKE
jgi:hypothetical protein